jgi:hypothetical protein
MIRKMMGNWQQDQHISLATGGVTAVWHGLLTPTRLLNTMEETTCEAPC